MHNAVNREAETLFLDLADWVEEHKERMAPDSQITPGQGEWLGRRDVSRSTSPWIHVLIGPANEQLWAELQRKGVTHWLKLSELYAVWEGMHMAKIGQVEIGGRTRRCVSLSVLHVAHLRQERTT